MTVVDLVAVKAERRRQRRNARRREHRRVVKESEQRVKEKVKRDHARALMRGEPLAISVQELRDMEDRAARNRAAHERFMDIMKRGKS